MEIFQTKKQNEENKNKKIRDHFESKRENYYEQVGISSFIVITILNVKLMALKIKLYQSKNTMMKLSHPCKI